ncbi:MAG: DUF1993 domain-containing protein [Caulobacter sp.]|nr:DUF1993 domain-containing protein [Caulobacter sp.]
MPNYPQALASVRGILDKGLAHATQAGLDLQEIVETRLCGDMLPFRFQIASVVHHSAGALTAVREGAFAPPERREANYAGLQKLVAEAEAAVRAWTPVAVNELEGRDLIFSVGEHKMPFVAEDFLFSFSLPNFYFHAATAYDILRMKGAPLGKRDFLGKMRMKAA